MIYLKKFYFENVENVEIVTENLILILIEPNIVQLISNFCIQWLESHILFYAFPKIAWFPPVKNELKIIHANQTETVSIIKVIKYLSYPNIVWFFMWFCNVFGRTISIMSKPLCWWFQKQTVFYIQRLYLVCRRWFSNCRPNLSFKKMKNILTKESSLKEKCTCFGCESNPKNVLVLQAWNLVISLSIVKHCKLYRKLKK